MKKKKKHKKEKEKKKKPMQINNRILDSERELQSGDVILKGKIL